MSRIVSFTAEGPLGDNLFQYFAAEIIKKIYGYDEVQLTLHINLEFNLVIDDEKFKTIVTRYMEGDLVPLDTTRNILLMGFFQRSEIFEFEREHLLSLFHKDNEHYINRNVRIKNIVMYCPKQPVERKEGDLTLHLDSRSQRYDPAFLKGIIQTIPHQRLLIVNQVTVAEKDYTHHFDELHPTWIHGTIADEFAALMQSSRLITSSSSLSWMAAFLGQGTEIHIPYNHHYGGKEGHGQSLEEFSPACVVYHDTVYWTPTEKDTPVNPEPSSTDTSETA